MRTVGEMFQYCFVLIYFLGVTIFIQTLLFSDVSYAVTTERKLVRVGIFQNKPIVFQDKNGVARGLYVDLINEIAKRENWEIKYVLDTFAGGLERLKINDIDLMACVTYTTKRDAFIDFSHEIVWTLWGVIFLPPESDIEDVRLLDGKKIAILKNGINGVNFTKLCKDLGITCNLVEMPSFDAVLKAVESKQVDAAVTNSVYGAINSQKYRVKQSSIIFSPVSASFAISEGSNRDLADIIDKHLSNYKQDSDSIYHRSLKLWLLKETEVVSFIPKWIIAGLSFLVFLMLCLFLWTKLLKRTVKEEQKKLLETEVKLSTVVSNSMAVIFIVDQSGVFQFSEGLGLKKLGLKPGQVVGSSVFEMYKDIPEITDSIKQALIGEIVNKVVYVGDLVFDSYFSPIQNEQGEITNAIGISTDITERKEAENKLKENEEELRLIFNASPIGICTVDLLGNFVTTNVAYERMVGYSKEELRGLSFFDVTHPDDRPKNKKLFQDMFSLKTTNFSINKKYIRKDGATIEVVVNATGVMDAKGNARFGTAFVKDITERKQAEKEKAEMQQQLFQSSKLAAIGELAAGVAHEINNPLAIINSYGTIISSALTKMGVNDEELKSYIKIQKESVTRITNIVDGLRTYARIDAGNEEIFNVNDIVRGSIDLIQNVYQKNDNTLFEQLVHQKDLYIHGNKGRFQQILMNLFSNAKDAMKDNGGGTITIELSEVDQNVIISVSDQGDGITQENMDKIFGTFFTTKEVGKGTGMGLSIVSSLVKGLNGKIKVESEEGKGAKFIMTLPRHDRKEVIAASKEVTTEFKELNGHILIVDDEEQLRNILKMLLEEFGLTVDEAENGKVALEKIKHNKFDVVMTDMKMPKMSGDKLIEEMAKKGFLEETKAFIVTGGIDNDIFSENSFLKKLQIGIITKPFAEEDIYEKLKKCLSSKS